jgi:flagellar biosynthesis anti-sigma factor FlgM
MKIDDLHPGVIPTPRADGSPLAPPAPSRSGGVAPGGSTLASTPPAGDARPAEVHLSQRSRELHRALEAARGAPEIRSDRVDDVRRRLAAGTYQVDPAAIAQAILDELAGRR